MGREHFVLPPIKAGGGGYTSSDSRPSSSNSNHQGQAAYASSGSTRSKRSSVHHARHMPKLPQISNPNNRINKSRSLQQRLFQSLTPRGTRWRDPAGFVRYSADEDCIKCMLRLPHKKCESHKYIRIGGGYRHSYWYVRALLEELEFQRQQEILRQQRLEAIAEKSVHAVKTYIRTKSGRLIEKIIFMSDEDYKAFQKALAEGGDPESFLKKYLSENEAAGLESYDKDEQVAIKTYIRTKSGRLIEKLVYVSKTDYNRMKRGEISAQDLLKSQLKDGETLEKWEEAKVRTITMKVRTKSGRIIEKVIQISEEDYQKMLKGGDMKGILSKYGQLEEGQTIEGWEKPKKEGMKVVKTYIRTKSGRLIEKTILMTEEEYKKFLESGGDVNFLKKFIKLEQGEEIMDWEKGSTVYSASDDEDMRNIKPGQRVVGKNGEIYEYVVDPLTGKIYKKKVGGGDTDSGIGSLMNGKRGRKGMGEIDEETARRLKQGKRDEGSDSEFSYRSFVSEGGTRHVKRRKKHADGHRSRSVSYHSSQDEEGEARRRKRRRERKHEGSAHSYYSVVSEGGTRTVRRKKKNADGTYGDSESYHSEDSVLNKGKKKGKGKGKKGGKGGSDSEYSYVSDVSAGGTRTKKRMKKIRDKDGNVIGYGKAEEYSEDEDGNVRVKKKKGRKGGDSDSDYSYVSEVSAGGTRTKKRRQKIRDKFGNVIGYGDPEDYDSDEVGRKKKKKPRVHGSDSEYSYYSEVSAGGTRTRARRKRIRDAQGNVIGHGAVEAYTSDSDSFVSVSDGKGGRMKIRKQRGSINKGHWKGETPVFSDATTDSDIVAEKLKNMTEAEREAYLAEREKRKAEREQKRREKYGDKYDEMMEQHERAKKVKEARKKYEKEKEEAQAKAKSMVQYGKGKARKSMAGNPDDREIGMAHETWGDKGKDKLKKKVKDGHEADGEDDEGEYGLGRTKKKGRKGSALSDFSGESVWSTDEHGNKIKKKIKIKDGKRYEYVYDKDGNLIKKTEKPEEDDGDYFEVDPVTGEIRLKAGKKKLDLSKLTDDQLRALGIDPNLSKSEIKRLLMEKFGDQLEIVDRGKKIGMKTLKDYGSDVGTDELADDSDFDVSTLRGMKRVNVKMRRGGQVLWDHLRRILEDSKLKDEYAKDLDERDGDIDFLAHYRLVDGGKLEMYGRAFVCEDEDFDATLNYKEMKIGLEGVPTVNHLTRKQMEYVMKVLKLNDAKQITFKMFAVVSAMCERVTQMDSYCKHLIEISNLLDIERKIDLYKSVFYCNSTSERDPNFITSESLLIELIAGGLNRNQQNYIMGKMTPNRYGEISFLDYMCYIPLFLSMHDNICYNPLDMSDQKYAHLDAQRRFSVQRDLNPLGSHLRKDTAFILKKKAHDLLEGKVKAEVSEENKEILHKYAKLPSFIGIEPEQQQTGAGQPEDMGVNIFLDKTKDDDDD